MNIYKIENKLNGKVYIGQTKREINKRVYFHSKRKSHVGNALRKYGIQSFLISIIDQADNKTTLDEKERYWIKYYDCRNPKGYNFTDGGDGLTNPSEETRQKIRDTKTRNPYFYTEEQKQKLRKPHRPFSEETKQKMRKPKSKETKLKMREYQQRPEVKKMHRDAMIGNKFALGNRISPEIIAKRSIKLSGKNNGMYGKHHTEETKEKIRKTKETRAVRYEQFACSNIL